MPHIDLQQELEWLDEILTARFTDYFEDESKNQQEIKDTTKKSAVKKSATKEPDQIAPPALATNKQTFRLPYSQLIAQYDLSRDERLALILALSMHLQPELLDCFFAKNGIYDRRFSELGGFRPVNHAGFIPTGETLAFVLAGESVQQRARVYKLFQAEQSFSKYHLLYLAEIASGESELSGRLHVPDQVLEQLEIKVYQPASTSSFPAQRLTTKQQWEDLVANPNLIKELDMLAQWQIHKKDMYENLGLGDKLRPGYRTLFYCPPGTGKTMTAGLLGKRLEKDVYRIDLSSITSKYIGETEKNLAQVFDHAEHRDWILFFDEADALFGKRSEVSSANDRYANQEVSYLLQRLEAFDGLVILATNLKDNMDVAFMRRFEQTLYFAEPDAAARKLLWQQTKPEKLRWAEDLDIAHIAQRYTMTGGMILNAIAYCSLQTLTQKITTINHATLITAIKRELHKVGKTI